MDSTEINTANVCFGREKVLPGGQCRFWVLDAEGGSEVVTAADGDVQEGDLPLVQLPQIAVNRPVSAENKRGI